MNNLEVINLYNGTDSGVINKFNNHVESKLHVNKNEEKVESDYEWLTLMEDNLVYIDNILRNPNRFIVNEEEVVKIERARRVTVESIKHLARNTNLIQDIDKKTGDVKPSKILNINKEENFNTYENRFIYSLIKNMQFFIDHKKKSILFESTYKNKKKLEYSGRSDTGKEKISIDVVINSAMNSHEKFVDSNGTDIPTRIQKLEERIKDLTSQEVYRNLARLHVALVTSPIKKTNLILKNTNFQYAVMLWNYIQEHTGEDGSSENKNSDDYEDHGELKKYFDESFLLDYLIVDTLNENGVVSKEKKEDLTERLIGNVVEKLIDINHDISEQQLAELVAKQVTLIKNKQVVSDRKIQSIYKEAIDNYMKKINHLSMESKVYEEEKESDGEQDS